MKKVIMCAAVAALVPVFQSASATTVQVSIENVAPDGGVFITPVWVAFHDGNFDIYDRDEPASAELERLAEDGNTGPISDAFAGSGIDDTLVGAGEIGPGETVSTVFDIDASTANRYFSYASMVLPSSDYFIANGDPLAHDLGGLDGAPAGTEIMFDIGMAVLDAGTEVNDFNTSAGNGIFGLPPGQGGPNQGADEGGVITEVTDPFDDFANSPSGLNDALIFTEYPNGIAKVTISVVSVPESSSTLALLGLALMSVEIVRRKKS